MNQIMNPLELVESKIEKLMEDFNINLDFAHIFIHNTTILDF